MKIIGAGLSKTGTTSLHAALQMLGLTSLHYDEQRLRDIVEAAAEDPRRLNRFNFRRYDDVDAVLDLPTAAFYQHLLDAYPQSKCILTVRDEQQWWKSVEYHINQKSPVSCREDNPFKWQLRHLVYGSAAASETLYCERYRDHNLQVQRMVPAGRLLVMNIAAGDGWEALCPFLELPVPDFAFPHSNRREHAGGEAISLVINELLNLTSPGERFVWVDECQLPELHLPDRQAVPFLERGGEYAGPPADSSQAIADCERQRQQGADWLIIAWPAFWWIDFYHDFHDYLSQSYPCLLRNERMVVFDLRRGLESAEARDRTHADILRS